MKALRVLVGVLVVLVWLVGIRSPSNAQPGPYRLYLPLVANNGSLNPPLPSPTPLPRVTLVSTYYSCKVPITGQHFQEVNGEVRNDGSQARYFVSVTATFYYVDQAGNTTARTAATRIKTNMILPGETIPFVVSAQMPGCTLPPGAYTLTASPGSASSPTIYSHQFSFTNTAAGKCPDGFFQCVTGQVTNASPLSLQGVNVTTAFKNSAGQPFCINSVNVGTLASGQTVPFLTGGSSTPPASFSLVAEGQVP